MSDIAADLRALADDGLKIHDAIASAARRAGLSRWRAFDIWYGKARRIEADERARVAEALDRKRKEAARNELRDLRIRLEILEARLRQGDEDFHRHDVAALRQSRGGPC
jgi:hypothetical protein